MQPQRETAIYQYGPIKGLASKQYQKDLKKRQGQGWNLVSCSESGKDGLGHVMLTAIYERPRASQTQPGPAMNIPNLPLLLSMLSPDERASFESEMQSVVNRWLARKAQG